ncbi:MULTISPECIES: hypothetical protein [Arthrospira]|uniref:Uncharacterized protein n=1 Tax=Limnospira platensis NIES-46 TaxID=1236695 RepID=A0A5M3T904_LIMPL|nr:hypothetical protein [Arthrospira platensis]AMW30037.1 hypothetical protein AP285_20965 [Arthrospira platensis YZ]KDR53972.1 hypothetical protein APPUASWS_030830 [Arthrospira platensis str. Paraca]MBD2672290.1 hypothetical protein [Arthrospira platensis FACHB-439]MDF2211898.1 hypothetical protein [Arthrospira platensis NCB002]MDT9185852.1 hypothetical protein [Limnospira sp. PMC 289.06]MDT9298178.1 hypothetical protein [Arthrospira platensis PCC 7345]MDT9313632.1 hypothetical protein [Lim
MNSNHKILAVTRPNKPPEPSSESPTTNTQEHSRSTGTVKHIPSRTVKPSKPIKHKPKVAVKLPQAENSEGEVFVVGDHILVRAPWGLWARAEIKTFYQSSPDTVMAHFIPKEERTNWTWMGGLIRSDLLKRANPDS